MGVIRERIDLETEESPQLRELRDYVGVSHEDADWELQVFAMVAVDLAEQYVGDNLDYLDEEDPALPLPDPVWLWILTYVLWRYERRAPIKSERTAVRAVEWEDEPDYSLLAPWRSVQI